MSTHERYELIDVIAKGDFATVFRARDRELGREVAIKQIHQQYLDDPAQLERYWQEAQLLASLEHPYIMTIYDVVRARGWLVLELMKGSLQQQLAGNPIDLEDLRLTLIYTLSALQFLHKNGIIHGDVKPGNLLLDRNNRIKLGDFGIARRISGDDGSVVKGATKYMAPEVLSDQFGPVGPHSDIYSLGFSAYELMCGSHFESLFPGLHMFGRDPQVAWMMWHAAPDRRLPEIKKVLEGVPEDLAAVIEKMTEKDPAKRYRNADRPLAELRARGEKATAGEEVPAAEKAAAARHARNKRLLLIGALCVSVLLSVAILLVPQDGSNESGGNRQTTAAQPKSGTLAHIERSAEHPYIFLKPPGAAQGRQVTIDPAVDRFFVNGAPADFAALAVGDDIEIVRLSAEGGPSFQEIRATRPVVETAAGTIASLDAGKGIVRIAIPGADQPREVYVPADARLQLNGDDTLGGRPVDLRDLKTADRVEVEYLPGEGRPQATTLSALRRLTSQGFVQGVNSAQHTLTMRLGDASDAPQKTLPLAADCPITINGSAQKDGQPIALGDLRMDDRIAVEHDARVLSIEALRGLEEKAVVASVDPAAGTFVVNDVAFTLSPECKIRVADLDESVSLKFLRPGDEVVVSHNSFDLKNPVATGVTILPAVDKGVWALVLADAPYADDARLVQSALQNYYRVPENQLFFADAGVTELNRPRVVAFLQRVAADSQLVAYVAGEGEIDAGVGYAMQNVGSEWLLQQLEATAAHEKLLVLDTCHKADQPSAVELAQLRNGAGVPVSESVAVLAGCQDEEKGLAHDASERGLLAHFTAQAFRGDADSEPRDGRIHGVELAAYLTRNMALATTTSDDKQTPRLFVPGEVPRLHPEVREAILKMLTATQLNEQYFLVYEAARLRAKDEPDVEVAHALALLKLDKNSNDALPLLQNVLIAHPDEISVLPMMAWLEFAQTEPVEARRAEAYRVAVAELAHLVRSLPEPPESGPPPAYVTSLMKFAGMVRHFAVTAADPALTPAEVRALDSFFLPRDDVYQQAYRDGIDAIAKRYDQLVREVDQSPTPALRMLREQRLKRIMTYINYDNFPFQAVADLIRSRLD